MKTRSTSALSSTASESSSTEDEDMTNNDTTAVDQYFTDSHIKKVNSIASEENDKLNLNLGLPVDLTNYTRRDIPPTSIVQKVLRPPIQTFIRIFDWLLSFIEGPLFIFWSEHVPLWLRQKITFFAWSIYLPIHKLFIGRRSGLHRDVSYEYHALTTAMWAGRLVSIYNWLLLEYRSIIICYTHIISSFLSVPNHSQTNENVTQSVACMAST